jgi:hypothetical protein
MEVYMTILDKIEELLNQHNIIYENKTIDEIIFFHSEGEIEGYILIIEVEEARKRINVVESNTFIGKEIYNELIKNGYDKKYLIEYLNDQNKTNN